MEIKLDNGNVITIGSDDAKRAVNHLIHKFVSGPQKKSFIKHNWTPEMEEEMRTMYASGSNREQIGEKLGVTSKAVNARIYKLGLHKINTEPQQLTI